MPSIRLTDLGVAHLKPASSRVDYWDISLPTFGVRVSPTGAKVFIVKVHNGRRTIGRYHPDILPLAKARAEAKRLIAEKTLGRLRPGSIAYKDAVKLFIEDKKRKCRPSTYELYEWLLNRFTFSQVNYITSSDVAPQVARIKSPSTAGHALIALRIFFNWTIKRQYREINPTLGITPHQSKKRRRVLSDDELRAVWHAANQIGWPYGTIVKLLILTGQRRGEIAGLRTSHVDGETVTLPPELVKNKRSHRFPLCSVAVEVLRDMPIDTERNDALFFPARGKVDKPYNGWSKSKRAFDKVCGVTRWTLHDLRRTYRTIHARIGTPPYVAERLINHVNGIASEVEQIYDVYTYLPEMRKATEAYEAEFTRITQGARLELAA